MKINAYKSVFETYFNGEEFQWQLQESLKIFRKSKRIFFIGNGGSNSICSHMMEDFAKMGRYPTFAFSDPALITCFANDYGYENAMAEWLKIHGINGDLLIAISSSGKSKNILNGVDLFKSNQWSVITLSGFLKGNPLSSRGSVNFHLPVENFGIVESLHQIILHVILDELVG